MRTVKLETTEEIFQFTLEDVVEVLQSRASEDEARELIDFLRAQSQDVIELPQEKKSLLYQVLDLLASDS